MGLKQPSSGNGLLVTGQSTVYVAGDDSSYQRGTAKAYSVYASGSQSGTSNLDVVSHAGTTLAFVAATKKITDSGNGLAQFKTGDTITVRGSVANDGTYTVATGNVAGEIVTTEALVNEDVGAYVSLCKRVAQSNICVMDVYTGLMWSQDTSQTKKCGTASDGKLLFYDATTNKTLHPNGADLQMIASSKTLKIVGGAGEVARYHVGDVIVCAGFANAVNNRVGYVVSSVTVNGADLDIVLATFNATLIAEAAGGSRSISLLVNSIWNWAAAANAASLGGYTDWRVPNTTELISITNMETTSNPNATAFPNWPTSNTVWAATTRGSNTANAANWTYNSSSLGSTAKTTAYLAALVRLG